MIVGVSGLAGSGKDAVADLLVKKHGFIKIALADPLKRICRDAFDFTDEQLWGPSSARNQPDPRYIRMKAGALGTTVQDWNREKETYNTKPSPEQDVFLTPRYALQKLGTEWGRDCYGNVWVDYAMRAADKILHKSGILRSVFYNYSQKDGLYTTNTPQGPTPKGVVISDVRFKNEVDAIANGGGILIRMLRGQGLEGAESNHRSETEQQDIPDERFNHVLDNREWSLEQLENEVDVLAAMHLTRKKRP